MKMFRIFVKGEMRKLSISSHDEKNQNHTERRKLAKGKEKGSVVSKQLTDIGQKIRNRIKKHLVKIYEYRMAVLLI
jgi:hypothetical protein